MRLHSLTHCGTFAFPNEINIDFDSLPAIVAVTGKNGSGKTSTLDVIAAPWIGEFAYRPGSLSRQFAQPGHIDLTWSLNGRRYRSVLKVDPASERTEGTLYAEDGTVIAGPLIRNYRQEIQQLVGPPEFFLASAYATQSGVGALLTASKAERKALLGELLGLQRYVIWEAYAKGKVRVAETQLAGLRARVAELGKQAEQIPELERQREQLELKWAAAGQGATSAEIALHDAQAALESARAALTALDPAAAELRQVEEELGALAGQEWDATQRRSKNIDVLGRENEIEMAAERMRAILDEAIDLELTYHDAAVQQQRAMLAAQAVTQQRMTAQHALTTAERGTERLVQQASLLLAVPCEGVGKYAGCALLKDAKAAVDYLPASREVVEDARKHLAEIPEPAPLVDATAPLLTRKRALEAEQAALLPVANLIVQLSAARARVEELDGQLAELGARQAAATARRDALAVRLAERPACQRSVNTAAGNAVEAQRQRGIAQMALSQVGREVGQVEGQLAAVRAAGEACAAAMAEVGPVEEGLSDWALLVRALGPSGIPALLVDQACPELGRLASELLRECYGEEVFSIALTTQRESAAGDKLLETLDVVVRRHWRGSPLPAGAWSRALPSANGDQVDVALLSGGEKVLVSEALSLALALYSAGRSGRSVETLLRDEVGAALDVERAPAYMRMLRRAAQLGGFAHVLVVSHSERAIELADARLEIADGRMTVS